MKFENSSKVRNRVFMLFLKSRTFAKNDQKAPKKWVKKVEKNRFFKNHSFAKNRFFKNITRKSDSKNTEKRVPKRLTTFYYTVNHAGNSENSIYTKVTFTFSIVWNWYHFYRTFLCDYLGKMIPGTRWGRKLGRQPVLRVIEKSCLIIYCLNTKTPPIWAIRPKKGLKSGYFHAIWSVWSSKTWKIGLFQTPLG